MTHALRIDLAPLRARPAARVAVALSGGLDSVTLLHALASIPEVREHGLHALHVDHGLHADAALWRAHCEALCSRLGLPIECTRVEVRQAGDGPEAAARRARHAAFARHLREGDLLALAHHQDDQAETFLLRALRASGPDGLRAMGPLRPLGDGFLWRPLLSTPRAALRAYARHHGLGWLDDPSNASDRFDRNFLRLHVVPRLRQRWPGAAVALARSAELCAEAADLLASADAALLARARTASPAVIDLDVLRALAAPQRARLLRSWIESLGLPPIPGGALEHFEAQVLHARPDAGPELRWEGARLRRWGRLLAAEAPGPAWHLPTPLEWTGETPLQLPLGDRLELRPARRLSWPVRVRGRLGGERILLPGRSHRHRLKHVLQERAVPPWLRERLPVLAAPDGEVLAAGDIAISARLVEWLEATDTTLCWWRSDGHSAACD